MAILGGSGYAGGELLRLCLGHPRLDVQQVTSDGLRGEFGYQVHPNLRGRTQLRFAAHDELEPADVLFVALPHGEAMERIEALSPMAGYLIDLSADFRLRDPAAYARWYGAEHRAAEWLGRFVYGLPEISRHALRAAHYAAAPGCNATAAILALWPLVQAGLVERAVVDLKVGSSEGGSQPSAASHHPERAGAVRSYAPAGHRHQAEVAQALGLDGPPVHLSVTAVELVRGVLATVHAFLKEEVGERELWELYRTAYGDEPFVRLVAGKRGLYRYPEPKILAGSNYADVGFAVEGRRVVALAAIDNLMKGAAGSALQSLNVMLGWPETLGLEFPGLHPI